MAASSSDPLQPQFELLNDEELDELINGTDSASTKRSLKFGWQRFEAFVKFAKTSLTDISRENLDLLLSKFYAGARKEDGTSYSKRSIQSIRYAVQRHYLDEQDFDICDKSTFPKSNRVYKAVLVKLKREGKADVKHKEAISPGDMEKIQNCEDLNCNTPAGLQNKVFVDLLMYFCNRGRENIRSMKPSDFSVQTDENGRRYLRKRDCLTKNRRENEDESSMGLMFEVPTSEKCPLKSYLTYVSKLNDNCPFLWQKPKSKVPEQEGEPWYCSCPIGVNTIANKIKQISTSAGCSRIYTNHCVRATCITSLDSAGFESRDVMSVSGHRSESSLRHYSKTGVQRKREMSSHLSKKLCCTSGTPAQSKKSVELQRHDLSDASVTTVRSTVAGEEHNRHDHGTESEEMSISIQSSQTQSQVQQEYRYRSVSILQNSPQVRNSNAPHFHFQNCEVHFHHK
ncbi:uncharacterized protein [Diadema setosum]|uniref:uncharacterized protein n=1 Tax=Diadema setosum TaxID=31175 RepID=UPI003B3B8609